MLGLGKKALKLRDLLGLGELLLEVLDLVQGGRRRKGGRRRCDRASVDTLKFLDTHKCPFTEKQEARSKKHKCPFTEKQEARMCIISWLQEARKQESDQVSHRRRTEVDGQVLEVRALACKL